MPSSVVGFGRLYFGREWALYLGPGLPATVHAHHAVQVCVPLDGCVRLRTGQDSRWRAYKGALIPSNLPHESDVAVPLIGSFWLEPSATAVRRLMKAASAGRIIEIERGKLIQIIPWLIECWNENWDSARTQSLLSNVLQILTANIDQPRSLDHRIALAKQTLDGALERRVSVNELAKGVSLSKGRLMHLFRLETGIPVRRYLLWLRLRDAIQRLSDGSSMTEAAIGAGFSDAPHFDRTFRRMLGFTPSSAFRLRVSTFVQDAPGTG